MKFLPFICKSLILAEFLGKKTKLHHISGYATAADSVHSGWNSKNMSRETTLRLKASIFLAK